MDTKIRNITIIFIVCLFVAFLQHNSRYSFSSMSTSMSQGHEAEGNVKGLMSEGHESEDKIKDLMPRGHAEEDNTKGPCVVPNFTGMDQFYSYFEKPKAQCNHMEQIGGARYAGLYLDGDKWVCFDSGFKPDDCVVYSFGINNEWSFDDDMDLKRHCKVFAFDPSMGAQDHNRSSRISFFNLGLSDHKGSLKIKKRIGLVDRYRAIIEKLGHETTKIDYLKMDIEGAEIEVFKDILDNDLALLDNVRQMGVEIHPGRYGSRMFQRAKQYWEIFHRLECLGWRLLSCEINQVPSTWVRYKGITRSCCYDFVWIKD